MWFDVGVSGVESAPLSLEIAFQSVSNAKTFVFRVGRLPRTMASMPHYG